MSDDIRRIGSDPDAVEQFYREHLDTVQRFVARRGLLRLDETVGLTNGPCR